MSETQDVADREAATSQPMQSANTPARASVRLAIGNSRFQADAEITPLGFLAIGGMVGAILLAVAPIVKAAGRARRSR